MRFEIGLLLVLLATNMVTITRKNEDKMSLKHQPWIMVYGAGKRQDFCNYLCPKISGDLRGPLETPAPTGG